MKERIFYTGTLRTTRYFYKKSLRRLRHWFLPGLHVYRAVFPFILAFFVLIISGIVWTITTRGEGNADPTVNDLFLIQADAPEQVEIISVWGDSRENGQRKHKGIDLKAPSGASVLAPAESWVVKIDHGAKAGNYLWLLDHNGGYLYQFMHLKSVADDLFVGRHVYAGEKIGGVGRTGNANTPHLHFEVARLGEKYNFKTNLENIDPLSLFRPQLAKLAVPKD